MFFCFSVLNFLISLQNFDIHYSAIVVELNAVFGLHVGIVSRFMGLKWVNSWNKARKFPITIWKLECRLYRVRQALNICKISVPKSVYLENFILLWKIVFSRAFLIYSIPKTCTQVIFIWFYILYWSYYYNLFMYILLHLWKSIHKFIENLVEKN